MNEEKIKKYNLDVFIVNFNSTDCVIHCIESLIICKPENCNLHIFVFDNASQDDPKRIINLFPKSFISFSNRNIGFGGAINQLCRKSSSEFLLLMNPDALATKELFNEAVGFVRSNPDVGIAGPKILNEDGGVQGSARAFPTMMTSLFGRNSPLTRIFPNNSISRANILTDQSDGRKPMEVDWVSGACMVVRREAMQAVGGFDKRFFLYWEDTDLCLRIWNAGWKVVYFPEARVVHSVGKSSSTRPIFANYQFHKSCYRLFDKYAKGPFSIFTPLAGIALMYRFLIAVLFNHLAGTLSKIKQPHKQCRTRREQKKHKIRILRVISRMNIGGPSIHVKNLTEGLNERKFEKKLITGSVSPDEGDMTYIASFNEDKRIVVPELQREINLRKDLIALIKTIKIIRNFRPDIVHSHTSKAGSIARLAALICNFFSKQKIIVVHTFHGHVLNAYFGHTKTYIFQIIEHLLAKATDRIIAISKTQKWELSQKYKIAAPSKIILINLGFDLLPFVHANKFKGKLRKKIDVSNDTLLIGIVGRLAPIKNHKMFIDAARHYLEKSNEKDVKFIVIGDGELRQSIEKYMVEIGLKNHVKFYGWEKNIPMIYADLDVLALTSLNEGTPVSIIEAMAASVPVITTGVGGIKDLLGRIEADQPDAAFKICERGILCPKNDSIAFSNALKFMIDGDYLPDERRLANARDFVLENYSIHRLIYDIEMLYERLIVERRAA